MSTVVRIALQDQRAGEHIGGTMTVQCQVYPLWQAMRPEDRRIFLGHFVLQCLYAPISRRSFTACLEILPNPPSAEVADSGWDRVLVVVY